MIPNSGKAMLMRNRVTGAMWSVSYDYRTHVYHFEPRGNVSLIRSAYDSPSIAGNLELAGTIAGNGFERMQIKKCELAGIHRQNRPGSPRSLHVN